MFGLCSNCPGIKSISIDGNNGFVTWYQWGYIDHGKIDKKEFSGKVLDWNVLCSKTEYSLRHTFIKRMQSKAFTFERNSVVNDENKVVYN